MNALMSWVNSQQQALQFSRAKLTRVAVSQEAPIPDFWRNPMMSKTLTAQFPPNFGPKLNLDPNHTTIVGGMCLLNTIDMKRISRKELIFSSVADFEKWYASWYPRIDQVHDAVGIPPGICKKIIYVSEDSFFAGRLASYTGLDKADIQTVLRGVHERQGHAVLVRYLRCMGYKGEVSVVYTSDIEIKMAVALKMWERQLGLSFRACDRDFAKVELMYTGFWLDILGLESSAVIYESAGKMILKGWLKLDQWFATQKYGTGINGNLGIVGYVPFLTSRGDGSILAFDEVPNFQNSEAFSVATEDVPWYVANMLFAKKIVVEEGPLSLPAEKAVDLIKSDLAQYYRT